MPKPKPVLTIREVADLKGVSTQAVHACVQRGTLTAYRSGNAVLILRDRALEAYLALPPQPNRKPT
jgi:excisionase family DNA binding protein